MTDGPSPGVILVRPSEPGNIGAVARAMANTGLADLLIVEPAAAIDQNARAFAVHATHILDHARRFSSFEEAAAPFSQLVGTSSQRSRIPQVELMTPRDLASRWSRKPQPATALVFGPERSGLTTEELAHCSILVRIPADERQPTFNLAQAVLILGYELFVAGRPAADSLARDQASIAEVEGLMEHARQVLGSVGFNRDDTFPAVFRDLRRLANRARLSQREVQLLRGVLRRAEYRLGAQRPSTSRSR